jgi:hypothetical protein
MGTSRIVAATHDRKASSEPVAHALACCGGIHATILLDFEMNLDAARFSVLWWHSCHHLAGLRDESRRSTL